MLNTPPQLQKRRHLWSVALGAFLLGGAVGAISLSAAIDALQTPELLGGLPSSYAEADKEFSKRIAAAIPTGTSEEKLIRLLADNRFAPTWGAQEPERQAAYDFSSLVCAQRARVWWRTDKAGRVIMVRTKFGEEGCW